MVEWNKLQKERSKQMVKTINGKQYNTKTARKIATADEGTLYEKKTGEYFLHLTLDDIGLNIIHPLTKKQAEKWANEIAENFAPFG